MTISAQTRHAVKSRISIIKRLRVKLDWVKRRVDSHNANAERLLKLKTIKNGTAGGFLKIKKFKKNLRKVKKINNHFRKMEGLWKIKSKNNNAIAEGRNE